MGVDVVMFPDTSDVLDAPQTGKHQCIPRAARPSRRFAAPGDSIGTIGLGPSASTRAASALEEKCEVAGEMLELPIGLQATDRFIEALRVMAGVKVPDVITDERGRLLDMITDMHQYFHGKRVALFGDPDQLVSLCEFLVCLDMNPVYIITGTPVKRFEKRVRAVLGDAVPEAKIRKGRRRGHVPAAPVDQDRNRWIC